MPATVEIVTTAEPTFGTSAPFLLSNGVGLLSALLRPAPAADVLEDEDEQAQMSAAIDWTLQILTRGRH
jgi:hypothetical protein